MSILRPRATLDGPAKGALGCVQRVQWVAGGGGAALVVLCLAKAVPLTEEHARAVSRLQQHPGLARLVTYACTNAEAEAEVPKGADESKGDAGPAGAPPPHRTSCFWPMMARPRR
jgi:hypothetical protein